MTKKKHGGTRRGAGRSTYFTGKKGEQQFSVTFTAEGSKLLERYRMKLKGMSRSDFLQGLVLKHREFIGAEKHAGKVPPPRTLLFSEKGRAALDAICDRNGTSIPNVLESLVRVHGKDLTVDDVTDVMNA